MTLRGARRGLPQRLSCGLLILAVRDGDIPRWARALARTKLRVEAVVHCAGALGIEPLLPLRHRGIAVGQMHPLLSFADAAGPELRGAFCRVEGDAKAKQLATRLAKAVGMRPGSLDVDPARYHAAAALLANGAATLASCAAQLLADDRAAALLAPLLASVAQNMTTLGLPQALTGPVRRGDADAVANHLKLLERDCPALVPLYRELCRGQVPLARELNEAPARKFVQIERLLEAVNAAGQDA